MSRRAFNGLRAFSTTNSNNNSLVAPPLTYISGEEMTRYCMQLILDQWIKPFMDISRWEHFDLSCKHRDATDDKVLGEAVESGARLASIFKEPTVTPTKDQALSLGLKKAYGSPNGAMRRGWNGISISRDTIHIEGIKLGFSNPVLFDRHAVGGEYGAGWKGVGRGKLMTTFFPEDDQVAPTIVDARKLSDDANVAVVYHNPLDNVPELGHHFFSRCLAAKVVPYVVTKKTVFKWQESFWQTLKDVFDKHYKPQFEAAGLLKRTGGQLQHLISDSATMQIIRWTGGGFGMVAHNYDGDMLTDEISQIHRSPGFITSNLVGKTAEGTPIKQFEASHGTVADLWHAHLRGEETSLNPLGLIEALLGALAHSAQLQNDATSPQILHFVETLRRAVHNTFRYGQGTRDLCGDKGLSTEQFVKKVAWRLGRYLAKQKDGEEKLEPRVTLTDPRKPVDEEAITTMFNMFDADRNGSISREEFTVMLVKLGIAPLKNS